MGDGRIPVGRARNDYSSVNVTTSAWVQLVASCPRASCIEIFDSSGRVMEFALAPAGNEASNIVQTYITPGGNMQPIKVQVSEGSRLAIRAVDANATSGQITVCFYQ